MTTTGNQPNLKELLIKRLFPVACVFLIVYVPVDFLLLKDNIVGTVHLVSFVVLISAFLYYLKTKNITVASNILVFLAYPVLLPWLATGGPGGLGFIWSLTYVVWAFFIATSKKVAMLWLLGYFIISIILVVLSNIGLFSIGYSLAELINIAFAFILTTVLVFLFSQARDYYEQLSEEANRQLKQDIELRKQAEAEVSARLAEIEKMNKLMVGRELKMIELKKQIKP